MNKENCALKLVDEIILHLAVFEHRYIQIILMLLSFHRQLCCVSQAAVLPTYELKWNFACKMLP